MKKMRRMVWAYGYSSKGRVRDNNEDSFVVNGRLCQNPEKTTEQEIEMQSSAHMQYYGVFDGIGGCAYGEKASYTAANVLKQRACGLLFGDVKTKLEKLTSQMNREVIRKIGNEGGSTVVMAALRGNQLTIAHAGDSRAYFLHENALTQVTADHTPKPTVDEKTGKTTRSHVIFRYVGDPEMDEPICEVASTVTVHSGDKLLLCSDGLSDMVSNQKILCEMKANTGVKEIAKRLFDQAMEAGGKDNTTLIVVQIG